MKGKTNMNTTNLELISTENSINYFLHTQAKSLGIYKNIVDLQKVLISYGEDREQYR